MIVSLIMFLIGLLYGSIVYLAACEYGQFITSLRISVILSIYAYALFLVIAILLSVEVFGIVFPVIEATFGSV